MARANSSRPSMVNGLPSMSRARTRAARARLMGMKTPGNDRQPSSLISVSGDRCSMTGLMNTRGRSSLGRPATVLSMMKMRSGALTWTAARPAPSAEYMVSIMSSMRVRTCLVTSVTGVVACRRPGSGKRTILRRAMTFSPVYLLHKLALRGHIDNGISSTTLSPVVIVFRYAEASVPTEHGPVQVYVYRMGRHLGADPRLEVPAQDEHLALVIG